MLGVPPFFFRKRMYILRCAARLSSRVSLTSEYLDVEAPIWSWTDIAVSRASARCASTKRGRAKHEDGIDQAAKVLEFTPSHQHTDRFTQRN